MTPGPDVRRRRFPFEFAGLYRLPLALLGVREATAAVLVDPDDFAVRFGPWQLTTPRSNLVGATVTGPYRWWRAIGPHLSLADRGVTLGSTTRAGVCVRFAEPVAVLLPGGLLRHPAVTVTVADVDGLFDALVGDPR